MKSNQTHRFDSTPKAEIQRSSFNRSHGHKTTFDSGLLVPIYVDEVLPGDTLNVKLTAFARLATPIKPIMDNIFMETFFFSVPNRQVWDNWAKFNGEQENPADSTDFVVPSLAINTAITEGSLFDYMGLPTIVTGYRANSLHFRAYNHIYNNWFRDQNLIDSAVVRKDDAEATATDYKVLRRRKRPDYFTSALPFPQKGPEITTPILGTAAVSGIGFNTTMTFPTSSGVIKDSTNPAANYANAGIMSQGAFQDAANIYIRGDGPGAGNRPQIVADLASATGVSINDLRQSFQVQKLLERDARSGTRYPEILKSHFGVTDPQMLVLQRPEFLGGGSSMVNINPVTQQTPSNIAPELTPQGNLAAYGTVTLNNHGFTKSFTEHCVVIGIVNVRADLTYQTGLDRMWSRQTRFDYFWPALAHLGEQEILNKEIWADGSAADAQTFGYTPRYEEYRFKNSLITGKFRSNDPATLDVWHLSQKFADLPTLSQAFIEDNPPIKRTLAVQTEPEFIFDSYFNIQHVRPLPMNGTPGLIDHF
nr:MAG: major capsid protein [Microvirus sp.]